MFSAGGTKLVADAPLDVRQQPGPAAGRAQDRVSRYVVVVLPAVPVTAATSSSRLGSPKNATAAGAIAWRASGTTSCGTANVERALDDERDGAARDGLRRELVTVRRAQPRTQKKSAPGATARVS